jgi:hypothetical protein
MKVIFTIASLFFLQTASVAAQPVTDSVIINNFVFDSSGSPWLGDWVYSAGKIDTATLFFPSAPPGSSAKWSICFSSGVGAVIRTFTHLSSGIYQLSCWAKSFDGGSGTAWFIQDDTIIMTKVLGTFTDSTDKSFDTNWIQYFLTDTLSLTSSDTFQIILLGEWGSISLGPSGTLINNISFVKLMPTGGVSVVPNASANLRVYPNPATDQLQIMGVQSGVVHLFDLMGRERMNAAIIVGDSKNSSATLDVSSLSPGMYFVSDGHSEVKFVKE